LQVAYTCRSGGCCRSSAERAMTEFVKLVDALHGRATIMVALAPTVAAIGLWQGKRKSLQQIAPAALGPSPRCEIA
jgi:hypothetical protein